MTNSTRKKHTTKPRTQAKATAAKSKKAAARSGPAATPRANTKQAKLIAMLRRPSGATIADLAKATGWQQHTVRGVLSGALKKRLGLTVISEKAEGQARIYRLP